MKKEDIYYQAMLTRDHRFDGKFFIGVKTTGIYCRPICPAKPKKENVEFFATQHLAEMKGYRPCLRCHPESAPMSPMWIGKSAVVNRALKLLHSEEMLEFSEDEFADKFNLSARHLRRVFVEEIGKTPKQIFFEIRLNLARKLITETSLAMADIAFASGFSSIRRFNDAFRERFKKAPKEIRRNKITKDEGWKISLPYRPPFDFRGLLKSYENHRIGNLEWFEDEKMYRVAKVNGNIGKIVIENDNENSRLLLTIDFPDTSVIYSIVSKVRNLFDLNSDPLLIANAFEEDKKIEKLLKTYPGTRLPSGWDPFEVAISTILGQLISIEQARMLVHDLIEIAGSDSGIERNGKKIKLFPSPLQIMKADLKSLRTTQKRKETLVNFSKVIHDGGITLEPTQDVEEFIKQILKIKGIGPWTANYIAMKSLRHTDSFPGSDLILKRSLDIHSLKSVEKMAPWRSYVAALFWKAYAQSLKKKKGK